MMKKADIIEKITPDMVVSYLEKESWIKYKSKRLDLLIYQYKKDKMFEQVTIPKDENLKDYKETMKMTIETIAKVNRIEVQKLIELILNQNTEILKIRINKEGIENGSILFEDALKLYENSKRILVATAQDILNPKIIHQGRIDNKTNEFISQCKFGQTEIGSYIISIICPLSFELKDSGIYGKTYIHDDKSIEFTKQVTQKIIKNINFIKEKIDSNELESFAEDSEKNNISVNFYEALNGMNLEHESAQLDFFIEEPETEESNSNQFVSISNKYYEPINGIIQELRALPLKHKVIYGKVTVLTSAGAVEERENGMVSVAYIDDDLVQKTIKVKLNTTDYQNAIEAHRAGKTVKIICELDNPKKIIQEYLLFEIVKDK